MATLRQLAFASAVAGLVLGARPATAQLVHGYVMDATTGERLSASYVAIFDTLGKPVGTGFAGPTGDFTLRAPRKGVYRLHASRLGYDDFASEAIDLRSDPDVSLLVRLSPAPVALPSLTVEAERVVAQLKAVGFYDRKQQGAGRFVTPDVIEKHNFLRVTDLMRYIPGARIIYSGGRPVDVILRGGQALWNGRVCFPSIIVDGQPLRDGTGTLGRGVQLNDVVSMDDVKAVEVYSDGTGMPVQAAGIGGACGAILLWTKR